MSAVDQCQPQVISALQKEGWKLESAPFTLFVQTKHVYIDLAMIRQSNGSYQSILFIEVKCFPSKQSFTTDLYIAFGQYIIYRAMMEKRQIPYPLFLSIPAFIYHDFFDEVIEDAITANRINIVIIDIETEQVIRWIEHSI